MTSPNLSERKTETMVSWVVVLCLVGIAAGILLKQRAFNPAILAAHELAKSAAPSGPAVIDPSWLPPTLQVFGTPESFTPDNLYDKINGKAEMYVSAGISRMDCQRFALKASSDDWFEWFCYGMNSVPAAFSVFSTQRRIDGEALEFAANAYRTRNAIFFALGTNYVEVVGSTDGEELLSAMTEMAQRFVAAQAAAGGEMPEIQLFPTENLIPGSIALQTSDAFGFDQFKNVFTARYSVNGAEAMAYIISCSAPDAAEKLSAAYRSFLLENGGTVTGPGPAELGPVIQIMGAFEFVFAQGRCVAGVHAAPTTASANDLGSLLHNRLVEKSK